MASPEDDFKHCVENLFSKFEDDKKPKILWSCFFSIPDSNALDLKTGVPGNVVLCPGPDLDLDYDDAVKKVLIRFTSTTFLYLCACRLKRFFLISTRTLNSCQGLQILKT